MKTILKRIKKFKDEFMVDTGMSIPIYCGDELVSSYWKNK